MKIRDNIQNHEWSYCLALARNGRYLILKDSESFGQASAELEKIGKVITGKIQNGLGSYKIAILALMSISIRNNCDDHDRLFDLVKSARNMAVHEGSFARHLSSRLIDIFLILEESIMTKLTLVNDVMVRNPIIAESWHMVGDVRREMLANSFSFLPIYFNDKWHFISDNKLMIFLKRKSCQKLNDLLSMTLHSVIETQSVHFEPATTLRTTATIDSLIEIIGFYPILVTKDGDSDRNLLGIITSFDLLY